MPNNDTKVNTGGAMMQTPKRKFGETSPDESVGKMSTTELMKLKHTTMSSILDEKLQHLPTKSDLEDVKLHINDIKSEVNNLVIENKELKEEVQKIKNNWELDQQRLRQLEDKNGKKKLIIRGLVSQKSVTEAVNKMYKEKLKIETELEIEQAKKLYEKNGKMTVMVEMRSVEMVFEVLKQTRKLAGSAIYIERDLSVERQQKKKVMIVVRKNILVISKRKRVSVRGDKLVIDENVFTGIRTIRLCSTKSQVKKN